MPRKKANKPPNAILTTCPAIYAKCKGCQMIGELKVCESCQYPECSSCIDKHQQEHKISQRKTKIDSLHQQTALKYERLEKSIENMAISLDLLKTTEETFDRTIKAEYDAYQQKLKQSKVINQQHINDLQHMWEEFEKMAMTSAEDCVQIDHMIDQIESSLTKKPIEFCFRPNLSTPSLGSLDEALSDPIISDVVQTKKQLSDVLASSSSPEPSVPLELCNGNDSSSPAPFIVANSSHSVNDSSGDVKLVPVVKEQQQQQFSKSQKRRKNQKRRQADKSMASAESNISTEEKDALRRINIHMVQNVRLIWVDSNINENNDDCKSIITQLRGCVHNINTFTDGEECIEFVETINDDKVCMVTSDSLGQHIVPLVHSMSQVDSVFIVCGNKQRHGEWVKEWPKIKGVFTDMKPVCEALKQAVHDCEHNAAAISFMTTDGDASQKNLNKLDCSFMYTQILKEIIVTIEFEEEHFKKFINYAQEQFADNEGELKKVKNLKSKYRHDKAIWWYTCESFLYPMLNRALRTMDASVIVNMGFFIHDLHHQLEQLHSQQFGGHHSSKTFILYRGQGLPKKDFEQMMNTKGGLMAFNNFLSTSRKQNVSLSFARKTLLNPDIMGILFVMTIDPSQSTAPFASINQVGSYGDTEDEVLFSMHSVFRIQGIQQMAENPRLYQVDLILTSDNDKDLRVLTEWMREDMKGWTGWFALGQLLRTIGQFYKAEELYQVLLNRTFDESEKGPIYNQIGLMKDDQGEYQEAIEYHEKALEIYRKTLPPNHLNLAASYNNIGMAYDKMGNNTKALYYYLKDFEITRNALPSNHPNLAASYNNIGIIYNKMGDSNKALFYYEKALKILEESLPSNHPDLAKSYVAHGLIHMQIGENEKSLSYYEKALKIQEQSLPPNHPDLGMSYNNIGALYLRMDEYGKALSYLEKALEIRQQLLPLNHPDFGASYNNIGVVYLKMNEYGKALSYLEKALEIRQQLLPPNHSDLRASYNIICEVYERMNDYSKACSFYERAVENAQHSLPPNDPDLQFYRKELERIKKKMQFLRLFYPKENKMF